MYIYSYIMPQIDIVSFLPQVLGFFIVFTILFFVLINIYGLFLASVFKVRTYFISAIKSKVSSTLEFFSLVNCTQFFKLSKLSLRVKNLNLLTITKRF